MVKRTMHKKILRFLDPVATEDIRSLFGSLKGMDTTIIRDDDYEEEDRKSCRN